MLALVLVVALPAATAFSSLPPGRSIHERITDTAAERVGFPEGARDALRSASIVPDMDEMEWDPNTQHVQRVDARGPYRAEHHCDRVPGTSDPAALNATVQAVQGRLAAAATSSRSGDPDRAVLHLGYALHAVQDCASHSDAVDQGLDGPGFAAVVLGESASPTSLRLTGFEPGGDDPERPAGDPYPHGTYAKDSPDGTEEAGQRLPDNRTKHEAARDLAESASEELLRRFLAELSPEELARLAAAQPAGDRTPKVDVPALPWPGVAAGLLLLAAAARPRRPRA